MSGLQEIGYEVLNNINKRYSTRETSSTNTLLDHVCTNINNHSFNLSIIDSSLSDHKQIFLEIGKLAPILVKNTYYKALDYEKLYNSVLTAKYDNCSRESDVSCDVG